MYNGGLMLPEESASFVRTCMESRYVVYSEHLNLSHTHTNIYIYFVCVCVYDRAGG